MSRYQFVKSLILCGLPFVLSLLAIHLANPAPVPERLRNSYAECQTIREYYRQTTEPCAKGCEIVEWEGRFDAASPPPKPTEGAKLSEVIIHDEISSWLRQRCVVVRLRVQGPSGERAHYVVLREGAVRGVANLGPYPL
jgi:hypothetical protein